MLIVGRSCPWAHRAWLVWSLRQLGGTIELVVVEPDPEAGRWRFATPFAGMQHPAGLSIASAGPRRGVRHRAAALLLQPAAGAGGGERQADRTAQPVARPKRSARIWIHRPNARPRRSGASGCRGPSMTAFTAAALPATRRPTTEAETELFSTLAAAETALQQHPWLSGSMPSLADVQLFPTLIRLELVYAPLFGVSRQPLWQLPSLWQWRSRLYAQPGVAASCAPEAWRRDYFGALFPLHPSGIVPAAPNLATLVGPCPGRGSDGSPLP